MVESENLHCFCLAFVGAGAACSHAPSSAKATRRQAVGGGGAWAVVLRRVSSSTGTGTGTRYAMLYVCMYVCSSSSSSVCAPPSRQLAQPVASPPASQSASQPVSAAASQKPVRLSLARSLCLCLCLCLSLPLLSQRLSPKPPILLRCQPRPIQNTALHFAQVSSPVFYIVANCFNCFNCHNTLFQRLATLDNVLSAALAMPVFFLIAVSCGPVRDLFSHASAPSTLTAVHCVCELQRAINVIYHSACQLSRDR